MILAHLPALQVVLPLLAAPICLVVGNGRVADVERQRAEVGFAEDGRDHLHEYPVDDGVHDRREGGRQNDRDGQVDHVAPIDEVLELLDHDSVAFPLPEEPGW